MFFDQIKLADSPPELSVIIPVYNGAKTIAHLVQHVVQVFAATALEIVLVNDGSEDDSENVCANLVQKFPDIVLFVHLSRNFGEHNAVLAGLNHSSGRYIAVLDDDGQNPPEELVRMLDELKKSNRDVVYGHYIEKQHSFFRNLGSRFNDRMATLTLHKPAELYLSSFKVMNRFLVNEIIKYRGPFPYIDGLIYRTTRNIGQIPVQHRANTSGPSRYNLTKLIRLWLNMFLNFSIAPLRLAVYVGLAASAISVVALGLIWVDKIWITKNVTLGVPTVLGCTVLFSGIELMILGLVGEYLGRLYLDHTGTPQFIVRYTRRNEPLEKTRVRPIEYKRSRTPATCHHASMKTSEYEIMFRVEDSHWWYRALHRWIFWALTQYVPGWEDKEILDAGCGTGAVLQQLANPWKHVGVDLAPEAIDFCRQRGLKNVREANIMSLPFADETFDAVICSSVLYHQWVTDVPKALNELWRVLRPEGFVILNLPACKFLHSAHDDAVLTAHRFNRREVGLLLEQNGFQICKLTAWTTLFFPAAVLARTLRMINSGRDFEAPRGPHLAVLNWLMALEFRLLQSISVPLGVALFCIARKRANSSRCENNAALHEALG